MASRRSVLSDLQTADQEETTRRPLTNDTKPNREANGFGDVEIFHSYVDFDKFCAPYRLPGKHEPTLILCTYDPEYDYLISKVVHKYHIWDYHLVSGMANVMLQDDLRRKGHGARISLLDIGCNVGAFTVAAAGIGFEVLAVDAMNTSLALMATSLCLNNLTSRVTTLHNAVSEKRELVSVLMRSDGSVGHSKTVSSHRDNSGLQPEGSTQDDTDTQPERLSVKNNTRKNQQQSSNREKTNSQWYYMCVKMV
nr:hypothetical protein BaRGS_008805 [Batillaria attramentaria]